MKNNLNAVKKKTISLLNKANRFAFPCMPRAPLGLDISYIEPKQIREQKRCIGCGRLIHDHSGRRCRECFQLETLRKYVQKMLRRQAKLRIANNIDGMLDKRPWIK